MIFGMGPMELGIILLIVLVIFGPKNLPKIGSALGKTVKNVREGMEDDEPAAPPASETAAESAPSLERATGDDAGKRDVVS